MTPDTQLGRFSPDGRSYHIHTPRPPRPWYNYLWHDHLVALVDQNGLGESFSQDEMGRRIPLAARRMLFMRDTKTGDVWNAGGVAAPATTADYRCTHNRGRTTIHYRHHHIETAFQLITPVGALCELWSVTVANKGNTSRSLQLFPFVDTFIDGHAKPQAYYMSHGGWDEAQQAVYVRAECDFDDPYHPNQPRQRHCSNFIISSAPVSSYDSRQSAFIGYGTWQQPDAVQDGRCSASDCEMEKPILALQTELQLPANTMQTIHFVIGTVFDHTEIAALRTRFFEQGGVEQAWQQVQAKVTTETGHNTFTLPDDNLQALTTHWLPHQISLGTRWARVRHNGYRDLMQDIAAMAFINPALALGRFKRVLTYQYSSGYAPRTWLNGQILPKNFADNAVWIVFAAYNLVMETGDLDILAREVAFNDGSSASIYEHVKRALDYLWGDRGLHGLCRIRSGDWNDALSHVGDEGVGVSVWLSQAWLVAAAQFTELAQRFGQLGDVQMTKYRLAEMRAALETHGWDGDYYLRAYDDLRRPLGSQSNAQGTLFLNTQSWAVLAGLPRGAQALTFAEKKLRVDLGILSVENAYREYDPKVGLMSRKTPGIQENGGVYLHASAFKLVADCQLKRREAVERALQTMPPFSEGRAPDGEPYVFSNCYFTIENSYRYGSSGQSWGTGTAGWFYMALLNHVFGLQPTMTGLHLDPCLPPSWKICAVTRRFRGATYHIQYQQGAGDGSIASITVNGRPLDGVLLPYAAGEVYEVLVACE